MSIKIKAETLFNWRGKHPSVLPLAYHLEVYESQVFHETHYSIFAKCITTVSGRRDELDEAHLLLPIEEAKRLARAILDFTPEATS